MYRGPVNLCRAEQRAVKTGGVEVALPVSFCTLEENLYRVSSFEFIWSAYLPASFWLDVGGGVSSDRFYISYLCLMALPMWNDHVMRTRARPYQQ
jgi:hypothetical protein